MNDILEKAGYEVLTATDGDEGTLACFMRLELFRVRFYFFHGFPP